jgi:hypothetical protein
MENQNVEEMKVEEIEKYYKYYISLKKSKEKYDKENRKLLNEKARERYKNDPEYQERKRNKMLENYYKKKEEMQKQKSLGNQNL